MSNLADAQRIHGQPTRARDFGGEGAPEDNERLAREQGEGDDAVACGGRDGRVGTGL